MKRPILSFLSIVIALFFINCTKCAERYYEYEDAVKVVFIEGPIKIDGIFDESAYTGARWTRYFGFADGDVATPTFKTRSAIFYDKKNIYIAFEVEDKDVWAGYTNNDDPIYNEEVVEFFVDPEDDNRTYYEFQVSPMNVRFDAFFEYHRSDLKKAISYNSDFESAVHIYGTLNKRDDIDKGYNVEIKIPFEKLGMREAPPKNTRFRMDMFRFERPERNRITEAHALFPTPSGDFHSIKDWGYMIFE